MPFAILSQLSEDSDSCLIWRDGQREPAAIGTSMNRINLCFLVICPQQPSNVLKLTEDGYSCEPHNSTCNESPESNNGLESF
jgi:hypothetical protein